MSSYYFSKEAKKEIERFYHQKLNELPIRYEFMNIETTFGDTNVIITGKIEKPPLVLLHGTNSCAPLAIEALMELTQNFRIYAIDILGQPNLSEEFRPDNNDDSYGKWMYEILSRLGVRNAFLVGISLGGFCALKLLMFDESRIAKAFLIAPAGIVNGNPLKLLRKVLLPVKRYKNHNEIKYLHQFLDELFTEKDEFAEAFQSSVFLHYKMDLTAIPLITPEEAQKIKTPVHIFAAENDLLSPGSDMLERAGKIFPSAGHLILLKNSKHVPSGKDYYNIAERIKNES